MTRIRHVCVIGAGLAGLACALAAASADAALRVDVLDAAPALASLPMHIDIGPGALRDLAQLGLADACVGAGFAYRHVAVVNEHGQRLLETTAPRLAGGRYPAALGMAHGALLRLLADVARQRGVHLHWNTPVTAQGLSFSQPQAQAADLVLLACGTRSALREVLFPQAPERVAFDQQWWHTLVPRPPGLERPTWVIGAPGCKLVAVPTGLSQAGLAVMQQAVANAPCLPASPSLPKGQISLLTALRAGIHATTAARVRPVHAALLPAPWVCGRALAVGGCAHELPPHLSQGAAQHLEDAVVLADLLRGGPDLAALQAGFMARRGARAAQVYALARQAAQWDVRPDGHTDLKALHAELERVVTTPA